MIEVQKKWWASRPKIFWVGGAVLLLIVAVMLGYFLWQQLYDAPDNQATVTRVVGKVGALYELPDEQPSVAQLQDPAALKGQSFYDNAQKGDYVLVYSQAKQALIYRESSNKLVNVDHVELKKP